MNDSKKIHQCIRIMIITMVTLYLVCIHTVYWPFFLLLLFFMYLFGIAFSTWGLLFDHFAYHKYRNTMHIVKLLVIAWVEAFTYNPLNSFYSLKGNFEYFLKGRKEAGTICREKALLP